MKPYQISQAIAPVSNEEINCLVQQGVFSRNLNNLWSASTLTILKKDGQISIVSDFRELNKRLICTPIPLPNIRDLRDSILSHVEYFTTIDILQSYHQMKLNKQSRDFCTIILPWESTITTVPRWIFF